MTEPDPYMTRTVNRETEGKFSAGKMLYYWLNFARVTAIYFLLTHHIRDSTTDPCFPKCVEDKHIVEHRFTFSRVLSSTHLELFGSVDAISPPTVSTTSQVCCTGKEVPSGRRDSLECVPVFNLFSTSYYVLHVRFYDR